MSHSLSLWFLDAESPQLVRVGYSSPTSGHLVCTRGNQIAVPHSAITGVFPWSRAVRGLSVLALRTYLYKTQPNVLPLLIGMRGSLAVALDSAIAKEPQWLVDLFGTDGNGRSAARRLMRRDNPEGKRPGPTTVSFGQHFISETNMQIFLDGERIEYSQVAALMQLLLQDEESPSEINESLNDQVLLTQVSSQSKRPRDPDSTVARRGAAQSLRLATNYKPKNLPAGTPPHSLVSNKDESNPVVIADSDLLVIKSVTIAWRLEEMLRDSGINTRRVTWSWSDELLEALNNGRIDIAIYNTHSARRFMEDNPSSKITLVSEWGNSMGGKNFYIMARKGSSWPCSGIDAFLERIKKGATIIVPERSDMLVNVLSVLNTTEKELSTLGVTIVSVPVSQGLEALDVNPEALLIHGQNVRFKGRFRGLYNEVLNYDVLPPHMQQALLNNSSNSLLVSDSCLAKHSKETLFAAIEAARREFFTSWTDLKRYPQLVKELVENERKYGIIDEDEMTYVVKQILYETYRFGRPGA
jgi:hypothetical protein